MATLKGGLVVVLGYWQPYAEPFGHNCLRGLTIGEDAQVTNVTEEGFYKGSVHDRGSGKSLRSSALPLFP
jgi:hypothetical protein